MKNPHIGKSRLPDISNRLLSVENKIKSKKLIEKSPTGNPIILKAGVVKVTDVKGNIKKVKRS
jgi:hypothetical protein